MKLSELITHLMQIQRMFGNSHDPTVYTYSENTGTYEGLQSPFVEPDSNEPSIIIPSDGVVK